MKKSLFISLLLVSSLIYGGSADSPDWGEENYEHGKILPGYIVHNNGDTVRGFVRTGLVAAIGISSSNQEKVVFYTDPKNKKTKKKYTPKKIKSYMVAGKIYRSIKYSGGLASTLAFNLLVNDGPIAKYVWYSGNEGAGTAVQKTGESYKEYIARIYTSTEIFQKGNEKPVTAAKFAFKFSKKMAAFVKEHEVLAKKVLDKEQGYRLTGIYKIFDEYNSWAASK